MSKELNLDTRRLVSETTLIDEEWKVVKEFPFYKISNYGRLMNKYGRILKPRLQNSGYYFYSLYDGRGREFQTQITVHKLVMTSFVGDNKGYDINHIDGNKLNNHTLRMLNMRILLVSTKVEEGIKLLDHLKHL